MKIDVIGCGSAFAKKSNTSSLLVKDDEGKQWLIDCGPTVPRALFNRDLAVNDIEAIYFTHIHPDHCTGLTALFNYWKSFKRSAPITIFCQEDQKAPLQYLASFANWPSLDLCFEVHWQQITDEFSWQDWQIETAETQHELTNRALCIIADGQRLFYSGDGRPTQETIKLMHGADFAFQECATFEPLAEDASHGDFFACKTLLESTDVGFLALYHCWDESFSDIQRHAAKVDNLLVSRDGMNIDLSELKTSGRDLEQ